jgi:transcriptional regulator of arginine metabolism
MRMTDSRDLRLRAIADLIRTRPVASQDEIAEALAALDFTVTQATISRDLELLGAAKVRRAGLLVYALPEEMNPPASDGPQMNNVFRDWVRSVDFAGNLVVIKTPPGSAHLVGVALDRAGLPEVAGTICGDDTIFVAVRDVVSAPSLAQRLQRLRI